MIIRNHRQNPDSTGLSGAAPRLGPIILAGISALVLPASAALAGSATITSAEGNSAVFEYTDTMLRMGTGIETSYAVLRDGTLYAVSTENGQPMVIDAGSMMRGFAGTAAQMAPGDLNAEFLGMTNTGRSETVAGIRGDVYEVRFRDEDGVERSEEIVLSKDKRALEFRDALALMLDVFSELNEAVATAKSRDIQAELTDMDAGVLRFGSEMKITAIDSEAVDPARFELPAAPVNLESLGGMLGNISQSTDAADAPADDSNSDTGGLFSGMMGALGGKVDRQTDRAGQSVENEIDRETDKQVDKAIGKAFGKLFGR